MNENVESNQKGGLYILDSANAQELQSVIELFLVLLEIKNEMEKKDQRCEDVT